MVIIYSQRSCHIITGGILSNITTRQRKPYQSRELGANTHGFANAMRSALREDPDVILVGEMGAETISCLNRCRDRAPCL